MNQNLQYVLDFANEARERLGRTPVQGLRKGQRKDGRNCPLSNTVNFGCRNRCTAGLYGLHPEERTTYIPYPEGVRIFVSTFDCGQVPELEGRGWLE